jgi:hypothetical protein
VGKPLKRGVRRLHRIEPMRLFVIISFVLVFIVVAIGQDNVQPKAIPSRRLVTRGDMYSPLSEIYLDLAASAGKPGDMIAMRICSPDPLPVAIVLAVVDPVGIGTDLADGAHDGLQYSHDHVFVLRSPNCPITHPPYVPVEFWGVPRGAALPPASEVVKLCQIKISGTNWFDVTGRKRNARSYRLALNDLLLKLRNDSEGIAVIYGQYNHRPSMSLKRSLKDAELLFKRSGMSPNRFFVRTKPWSYEGAAILPEQKFPNFVVVDIAKDCDEND